MKPKILIFLENYLPGYKSGGPIQAIKNLTNGFCDYYDFYIIAKDRDYLDIKPYPNIKYGTWNIVNNAKVMYLPLEKDNSFTHIKIMKSLDYDLLYLQSFWNIKYALIPIFIHLLIKKNKVPILLNSRGQFFSSAFNNGFVKKIKKETYIFFFKLLRLHKKINFQLTFNEEKIDFFKKFSNCNQNNVFVAEDIPAKPNNFVPKIYKNKVLNIIFFSRINKHKNLNLLLKNLSKLNIDVKLDIYGTVDDKEEWDSCCEIIKSMPKNVEVNYLGAAEHNILISKLEKYDIFCLFSKSENFCFSIYEALSSGLPIIISNQTPWHKLKEYNAGWEIPIDKPEQINEKILEFYHKTDEEKLEMKKGALQYSINVYANNEFFDNNKKMFDSLIYKNIE